MQHTTTRPQAANLKPGDKTSEHRLSLLAIAITVLLPAFSKALALAPINTAAAQWGTAIIAGFYAISRGLAKLNATQE